MCRIKSSYLLIMVILMGTGFPRISQAPAPILEEGQLALAPVDYLPPAMTAIDVVGDYAYVGAGPSLLVFDVSDPANPQRVGYTVRTSVEESPVPYHADALVATPGRVYLRTGYEYNFTGVSHERWLIYDVSQAEYPRLAAIYDYGTLGGKYLAAEGMRLYVATGSGVKILDATDPLHLVEINTYANPDLAWYGMIEVQDGILTLLAGAVSPETETEQELLLIVDLTDPSQPVEIGRCEVSRARYAKDMHVTEELAVIVDSSPPGSTYILSYAELVDLSDPAHPASITTFFLSNDSLPHSAILGQLLITGPRGTPPDIYDISDPSAPQWLENLDWPSIDTTVDSGLLYNAGGAAGLSIYTNPSGNVLEKQGGLAGIGRAEDISLESGKLAIADGGHALVIYERFFGGLAIAEAIPGQPLEIVGKGNISDYGEYIAIDQDRAFLFGGECPGRYYDCDESLYALDISQPSDPEYLGKYSGITYFSGPITIREDYAYLAGAYIGILQDGIAIFDVSQPVTPTLTNFYQWSQDEPIYSLAITGTLGLVSSSHHDTNGTNFDLYTLDFSNPISPTIIGSNPAWGPLKFFLHEGLSFISDNRYEDNSLYIFDTGQLPLVDMLAEIYTDEQVLDVAYDGRYAYVANGETGLVLYDLADPAAPKKSFSYDTAGTAKRVILDGEYVYLADGEGGLWVFRKTYLYPQAYLPLVPSGALTD